MNLQLWCVCVCVLLGSSHGYYWSNARFRGSWLESVQLQHSYQTFPILLPRSEYIVGYLYARPFIYSFKSHFLIEMDRLHKMFDYMLF